MKTYTLKDYINVLKKHNLVEEIILNDIDENTQIPLIAHNSKNVVPNTLYICKGMKYKPEYLLEAIHNGAIFYVSEKENASIPDFPHAIVSNIRKALAVLSELYYD